MWDRSVCVALVEEEDSEEEREMAKKAVTFDYDNLKMLLSEEA